MANRDVHLATRHQQRLYGHEWGADMFFGVAGPARGHDVAQRMTPAFRQWRQVVLRQVSLRPLLTVGAAMFIRRLHRYPLRMREIINWGAGPQRPTPFQGGAVRFRVALPGCFIALLSFLRIVALPLFRADSGLVFVRIPPFLFRGMRFLNVFGAICALIQHQAVPMLRIVFALSGNGFFSPCSLWRMGFMPCTAGGIHAGALLCPGNMLGGSSTGHRAILAAAFLDVPRADLKPLPAMQTYAGNRHGGRGILTRPRTIFPSAAPDLRRSRVK